MIKKNKLANSTNKDKYLYTKGREFSLEGKNYIGEYHLVDGKPGTGPVPDNQSKSLTKFYPDPVVYNYDRIKQFNNLVTEFVEPNPIIIKPMDIDYDLGYIDRFFVEKSINVEKYPTEIDNKQYQKYNTAKNINGGLYLVVILRWKLTGPLRDRRDGKGNLIERGIYEHNALEVERGARQIPNISYIIKNYIEFARPR
jgi:hypothetical protein